MNYRIVYMKIIENAKKQNRRKGDGTYYELHHILPKSIFPLWKKRKSNLVLLTAREHFFCHQLLEKIYPNSNMFLALWFLANDGQNKYCSSREYQKLKERYSFTEKHKQHIKEASQRLWASDKAEEVRDKIKKARAEQKNLAWGPRSDESKKHISEATKAAMENPELRELLSKKSKEYMNSEKGKEQARLGGIKGGAKAKEAALLYKQEKLKNPSLTWNEFQKTVHKQK